MTKKKIYIPFILLVLVGVAALVFFLIRPEPPLGKITNEREASEVDMPESPGPPMIISFLSFYEILQLRAMLKEDDGRLFTFLQQETRGGWYQFETRENIEAFFVMLDNLYLPTDTNLAGFTYSFRDCGHHDLDFGYGSPDDFRYRIRIIPSEETSRIRLETAKELGADITDELSLLVQINTADVATLRVGDGFRVYRREDLDTEIRTAFYLDVQGTLVLVYMFEAPSEAFAFEVLANIEFARGVFAP